jgi:hypothetical protein
MRLPDHSTSTESFSIILCIREEILLFRSRDENDKVEDGSMLLRFQCVLLGWWSLIFVGLMLEMKDSVGANIQRFWMDVWNRSVF